MLPKRNRKCDTGLLLWIPAWSARIRAATRALYYRNKNERKGERERMTRRANASELVRVRKEKKKRVKERQRMKERACGI